MIQNEPSLLLMALHRNADLSLWLQFFSMDYFPSMPLRFDNFDHLSLQYRIIIHPVQSALEFNDFWEIILRALFTIINLFKYLLSRAQLFNALDILGVIVDSFWICMIQSLLLLALHFFVFPHHKGSRSWQYKVFLEYYAHRIYLFASRSFFIMEHKSQPTNYVTLS